MLALGGIAVTCSLVIGFGVGYKIADGAAAKRDLAALNAAQAAYAAKETEYATLSATYESLRATRSAAAETRTRTIEKIVERPVYHNVCLDDDGLRLINDAASESDRTGEPAPAVPTTARPDGR